MTARNKDHCNTVLDYFGALKRPRDDSVYVASDDELQNPVPLMPYLQVTLFNRSMNLSYVGVVKSTI